MAAITTEENSSTKPFGATRVPALYAAEVAHSRRAPIVNRFRYRVSYWLVDYDQLPQTGSVLARLARFEHRDHADIRAVLAEHGITAERILMLAMARTLGYVFNPISVFWCENATGARVAVLVEVHNTYGGRHIYFLQPDQDGAASVDKALYVSPFYPVDGFYQIRIGEPGASLSVSVTLQRENEAPFVATLKGQRRPINTVNVLWASLGQPALRAAALIRWQAIRMWWRGLKVQPR